jgi:ribosomal protein L16 Arg81 hydroxylase
MAKFFAEDDDASDLITNKLKDGIIWIQRPGDTWYLPPMTPHMTIALRGSVAAGLSFWFARDLSLRIRGWVMEMACRATLPNPEAQRKEAIDSILEQLVIIQTCDIHIVRDVLQAWEAFEADLKKEMGTAQLKKAKRLLGSLASRFKSCALCDDYGVGHTLEHLGFDLEE